MIRMRWLPAVALAALMGCGSSPPLHYYTLEVVTPVGAVTPAVPGFLISVRHIGLPSDVDHRGITHSTGPQQLEISDNDQWGAPLGTLIQGTFSRDLGARLGYEHVVAPAALPVAPLATPNRRGLQPDGPSSLDLDFLSLLAPGSCGIDAQINWTLSAHNTVVRRGTAHLTAAASNCPAGLPGALSSALGQLADQLTPQLTGP